MLDYFIENFNWFTFFFSFAVFILVSNMFNLVIAQLKLKRARENVEKSDRKLARIKKMLKTKDRELKSILHPKEGK